MFSARDKIWIATLTGLVTAQVVVSLVVKRGTALIISSDLLQGTLLLLATLAFLPNIYRTRAGSRARFFWILMSLGMFFWLAYQAMWNYFEVLLRADVPEIFAGDMVLFLHLVPMIAALSLRPHLKDEGRSAPFGMLDFALLLAWWVFLYVYCVIPWQYVEPNGSAYSNNYNQLYLTEKLLLLAGLIYMAYNSRGGWRYFYGQFLVAIALYASSSYVANWAIGRNIYYTGSIYDIPLTLSIAWIAVLGRFACRYSLTESDENLQPLFAIWVTRFSMMAVFSLPFLALVSQLDPLSSPPVKTFRVALTLIALVFMGGMVFWRQRLLAGELAHLLELSRRSYQDLQALHNQLIQSEKLASLGRLVGGAAHEINNPLAAMLGYSDMLSASELRPEERRVALRISEQVRRTRALVGNLLSFANQSPARWSAVDLNSLVQTAVRLLQPQLETHAIAVQFDLGSSLPILSADSNQLLRVVLHLAGQVCSQFDDETPGALHIRTRCDAGVVIMEFSCGSSPSPDRKWLPVDANASDKYPTLSLNMSQRIVSDHGGRILAEHSESSAVSFRVELPVAVRSPVQNLSPDELGKFGLAATVS